MNENILVIVAHSDDQIIGVGGTIAKYSEEEKKVRTIIVSKGEVSYPHFKEEIIVSTREKESLKADKIVGGKGVKFIGLAEKDIKKEKELQIAKSKVKETITKLEPIKIFTHSPEDRHPVHKAINKMVTEIIDETKIKTELYTFNVWGLFKWNKQKHPSLVVDITEQYPKKIKALKCFKSQFSLHGFINFIALATMYIQNIKNGRKHNTKYAEVFNRRR